MQYIKPQDGNWHKNKWKYFERGWRRGKCDLGLELLAGVHSSASFEKGIKHCNHLRKGHWHCFVIARQDSILHLFPFSPPFHSESNSALRLSPINSSCLCCEVRSYRDLVSDFFSCSSPLLSQGYVMLGKCKMSLQSKFSCFITYAVAKPL